MLDWHTDISCKRPEDWDFRPGIEDAGFAFHCAMKLLVSAAELGGNPKFSVRPYGTGTIVMHPNVDSRLVPALRGALERARAAAEANAAGELKFDSVKEMDRWRRDALVSANGGYFFLALDNALETVPADRRTAMMRGLAMHLRMPEHQDSDEYADLFAERLVTELCWLTFSYWRVMRTLDYWTTCFWQNWMWDRDEFKNLHMHEEREAEAFEVAKARRLKRVEGNSEV